MLANGCGRDCGECSIFDLCGGCESVSCLVRQCCLENIRYVGLTYPKSFCAFRSVCPRGGSQKLSLARPREIPESKPRPAIDMPHFMPMIKLDDETTWFWDSVRCDALIIKLEKLLSDEDLFKEVESKGIHDFLGFEGKIIVSSVMPDELLDRLTGEKYVELLNAIGPDAAMILDCYTYVNDPLAISWSQLFKLVDKALYAIENADIPLLGMVKGANPRQVSWCVDHLLEMGLRTLVLPYRELARMGKAGKIFFKYMLRSAKHSGLDVVIYGTPSVKDPFLAYLTEDPRVHFASLSWFLRAEAGMVYIGSEAGSLQYNILYECDCKFCRGRRWSELIVDTKSLALHNLTQIIGLYKGQ